MIAALQQTRQFKLFDQNSAPCNLSWVRGKDHLRIELGNHFLKSVFAVLAVFHPVKNGSQNQLGFVSGLMSLCVRLRTR